MSAGRVLKHALIVFLILAVVLPALLSLVGSVWRDGRLTLDAYRGFVDPGGGDLEALIVTIVL